MTMNKEFGMKYLRNLLQAVCVLVMAYSASVSAEYNVAEAEGSGVIRELRFGDNVINVGGAEYQVSPSVQVEINGSYGAFTMLKTGMKIEFTYLVHSGGDKVMNTITEVPQVDEF